MAYGQIRTSSGRVLNLSPAGWINNEGENLNDAPLNPLAAAALGQQQPTAQPQQQGQVAQVNALMQQLQPQVELDVSRPVEVFGKGKGFFGKNDPLSVYDAQGNKIADLGTDQAATRQRQKEDLALESARADLEHKRAQTAQLMTPEEKWELQKTDDGIIRVNKSTGIAEPVKMNGQAFGGGTSKKVSDANDVLSLIDESVELLPKAHGSGLGSALGAAANFFGINSEQNKADAQLKVVAGALVSKMPKMSGPQSDKDVQLYREMAGQIGDSTIPFETRLAALNTVGRMNARYAGKDWTDITPENVAERIEQKGQNNPQHTSASLPPKNAKGWLLHVDANGNKAYVGPNREIEEVQ